MASWEILDDRGTFRLPDADRTRYLYFPLVGEGGPFAAVSPGMAGDHALSHEHFLSVPSSVEDLHEARWRRAVWLRIHGHEAWAADGGSAAQRAARFDRDESATVTAGPLWHSVTRIHAASGLKVELTSLVPPEGDAEVLHISVQNAGDQEASFDLVPAMPIYGRSADSVRDHRHVTALLNHAETVKHGVVVRPRMIFDERGHKRGDVAYFVYGAGEEGAAPAAIRSCLPAFTGEAGDLDWPAAVVAPEHAGRVGDVDGEEAIAALEFATCSLRPGETRRWSLVMGIRPEAPAAEQILGKYGPDSDVLERTRQFWDEQLDALSFRFGDRQRDGWLRWVGIQPILRRHFGNSFLPYHDYGRGGRGWRDLWQDSLALLLMGEDDVEEQLYNHFAGVRMDGTNATIIGSRPGEFLADRNAIARVWMDHGAWPLLTVRLLLDRSGDPDFLLRKQVYFRDRFIRRARALDDQWSEGSGTVQKSRTGEIWRGTILEHLVLQHLTAYYNAGENGCLRLEDADWNDGMDLGRERGESVAFTALYAGNLADLADLVDWLAANGQTSLELASDLQLLLDGAGQTDPAPRRKVLDDYVDAILSGPSESMRVPARDLAATLRRLSDSLAERVREQEWLQDGWFNGYYDNHGRRVEGHVDGEARMTLTGQVFPLLAGIATDEQASRVYASARKHLWRPEMAGYLLNTDFDEVRMDLGRAFGFAYGHKENGAMFTHMAVMFAFGLARYGMARECWELVNHLYRHTCGFERSRMYPGLPEYVDPSGRGRYPFLTGSAAWYLHVMLTWVMGVRGDKGDLTVSPGLPAEAFEGGSVSVSFGFAGRRLTVEVNNPAGLDADAYGVAEAALGAEPIAVEGGTLRIARSHLLALDAGDEHRIVVHLGPSR